MKIINTLVPKYFENFLDRILNNTEENENNQILISKKEEIIKTLSCFESLANTKNPKRNFNFKDLFKAMQNYKWTKQLFINNEVFNYWFPVFSESEKNSKLIKKIYLESLEKFYFAWIFEKEGIQKISKSWLKLLNQINFETVAAILLADKNSKQFTQNEVPLDVVNAICFKYADSINVVNWFKKWEFSNKPVERSQETNFLIFESDFNPSEKPLVSANDFLLNDFFKKESKFKKTPLLQNISFDDIIEFFQFVLELSKTTHTKFSVIKSILVGSPLNFSNKVSCFSNIYREMKYNNYHSEWNTKINIKDFFSSYRSHNINNCNICKDFVKKAEESHTSPKTFAIEHLTDIWKMMNGIEIFEPYEFEVKNYNFKYLNDSVILKTAAISLKNCMYSSYSSTLSGEHPETVLFAGQRINTSKLYPNDYNLGIELKLKKNVWTPVQCKRKCNDTCSKEELKLINELAQHLTAQNWRPSKPKILKRL